jgi:predicted ester cyclase
MFRSAFPDLTYRIDDLFSAGDKVVMRWTATATDTVGFMGRPPTGPRASATGINIYRSPTECMSTTSSRSLTSSPPLAWSSPAEGRA